MARPIILVKRELLDMLLFKHGMGVPVCTLIKQHKLTLTHPTLTKLLSHHSLNSVNLKSMTIYNKVQDSLFPPWLSFSDKDVQSQPPTWKYVGVMPLGEWIENNAN